MTIAIFLVVLLGGMAIGMPIAFALLLTGAALMWQLGMWDSQILAQNVIEGANSFPLLAVPFFMLAGEIMNAGGLSRRIVPYSGRLGLCSDCRGLHHGGAFWFSRSRRGGTVRLAVADDDPRWA
jgi:TRAP-type mannitol/chloroaromatic compound transport system permease large subunit